VPGITGVAWTVIALGALIAIWWPIRAGIAHRIERNFERAHPRNADGYIIGAEPFFREGTRGGAVLVLHGYNDSPQSMQSMAAALHAAGWTVRVPALPGHGRTLQEFAASRAADWERAAHMELAELQRTHRDVAVCGMSMGGALAFTLAADAPTVRAVIGLAPYLHLSKPMSFLLLFSPLAELGARYLESGGGRSVHDPEAARAIIAYRMAPPRLLYELTIVTRRAFAALARVRQPVLVLQSREDNRIPVASAERAFERVASTDKRIDWLTGTGHVITVDYGHREVERRVVEWLDQRLP
jgi:carboxylesterase